MTSGWFKFLLKKFADRLESGFPKRTDRLREGSSVFQASGF